MRRPFFIISSLGALGLAFGSGVALPVSLLPAVCRRASWGATPGACGDVRRRRTFQSGYTRDDALGRRFSR
jgi:hypothetical protein